MGARFRSWWQKRRRPLVVVGIIALVVGAIALIAFGYILKWNWTGFLTKNLWDWMQLLIIPIVLAIGGFWLNQIQKNREQRIAEQRAEIEQKAAEKRAKTDHDIALDSQQETNLQAYLDRMSELLLKEGLRDSEPYAEVRKIARAWTLTVLPRLDGNRKGSVLQFLHESGLVIKGKSIIDLSGADFSGTILHSTDLSGTDLHGSYLQGVDLRQSDLREANLSRADLIGANLSGADLSGADLFTTKLNRANLSRADLIGAILIGADLSGANVTEEQLDKAKSLQGTTMPDGSKHP